MDLKNLYSIFVLLMRICLIFLLLAVFNAKAQRIDAYDTISTNQQDYPWVVQTLDDGTLLMGAVIKPWLLFGKGKLLLVRMDINGFPMYHRTIELPELGVNLIGGIFKTSSNEYTIFCTFDSSLRFNDASNQVGYLKTDTLFQLTENVYKNYINTSPISRIYDIKVKQKERDLYFGKIGIGDSGIRAPYIANILFDLKENNISIYLDTLQYLRYQNGQVHPIKLVSQIPHDFLIGHGKYLIEARSDYEIPNFVINAVDLSDSITTGYYLAGILPYLIDSVYGGAMYIHSILYRFRVNMKEYKKNYMIIAGTATYRYTDAFTLDTLYKHKPGQSVISILDFSEENIESFNDKPIRSTFVENIREAFFDTINNGVNSMSRLYLNDYSSAFMQCLDFWDENKIYFGRQIGDRINLLRPYFSMPSILLISQFDSTLNKVWERRIVARNSEGIVSVNATHDGGVILVTRSSTGPFDDPYIAFPVHACDIAVYKFNEHGVITSYKKVLSDEPNHSQTHTLYPNPAKDLVRIKGDSPIHSIAVWDSQGKQHSCVLDIEKQSFTIEHLPKGIYYVQLFDANSQLLNVVKVVKE